MLFVSVCMCAVLYFYVHENQYVCVYVYAGVYVCGMCVCIVRVMKMACGSAAGSSLIGR